MQKILGLQIDPLPTLNLEFDSSLYLAYEAQKRGYSLFTYQPKNLFYANNHLKAYGQKIALSHEGKAYHIIEETLCTLEELDTLLIRQDPPFDQRYMANLYLLELLEHKVRILNSPRGIKAFCEKTLPLFFPDFIPPTIITENAKALYDFSQQHEQLVLKPLFGHGGHGVITLQKPSLQTLETLLTLYHTTYPGPIIGQKFLNDILKGDKRILLIQGEPVSIFKRHPKTGDIRSNMVQGGTAEPCDFSKRDMEICAALKPLLKQYNLSLVGIDIIGDYLMEVNVTSPTGLRAAEKLYDMNLAQTFWENIP